MDEQHKISTEQQREDLKNEMVSVRENGNYEQAIQGFEEVLAWDRENNNLRGEFDVMGHKRIAYVDWASNTSEPELKDERLQKALQTQNEILTFVEEKFPEDKPRRAMAYAHFTDILIEQIKLGLEKGIGIQQFIDQAGPALDYAFENLGGSEAHKATLWNKKAQILYASGDIGGALSAIQNGEMTIYNGYEEELKEIDGIMKIRIWQTGLWMTHSYICIKEKRSELARLHIEAILSVEDPKGTLNTRKKQAQRLLDQINSY